MFFLSESAEVYAFSVLVPIGSGEGISVRTFEGGAGGPECFLSCPEIGGAGVVGRVVAYLGNEPGSLPFGDAVGLLNELGEVFLVKSAGERAGGIALIGVRFTLMPQDGSEAIGAEDSESVGEFIEEETFAFPFAVFELRDFVEGRRRIGEAGSFRAVSYTHLRAHET